MDFRCFQLVVFKCVQLTIQLTSDVQLGFLNSRSMPSGLNQLMGFEATLWLFNRAMENG